MKEIEAYNAEHNTDNTNRIRYYKDKLKEIGGGEKKFKIPFKHRLLVNTRKKVERKNKREEKHKLGLPIKNKKHKRK